MKGRFQFFSAASLKIDEKLSKYVTNFFVLLISFFPTNLAKGTFYSILIF